MTKGLILSTFQQC